MKFPVIALSALLTACGGGGGSSTPEAPLPTPEISLSATAPNDNLVALYPTPATASSDTLCGYQVGTQRITGVVTSVHDGDTLTINNQNIRLDSIDAPELKQAYGQQAQQALANKVLGKTVTIAYTKKDKYGRIVGAVFTADCAYVNLDMVAAGAAWFYRAYQCETSATTRSALAAAEDLAQATDRGLWAGAATAPWVYRNGVEPTVPTCSSDSPTWVGNTTAPTPIVTPTPTPIVTPPSNSCFKVWVNGYRKSNGTWVNGYWRNSPGC